MSSKPILPFCAIAIAAAIIGGVFSRTVSSVPFAYDEADYMYAGTRGLVNNYLDQPSMSLAEFIQKGLELRRDKEKRHELSAFVRESGDINFYRHYHGPMYSYWIALAKLAGAHDEFTYRASGLIIQGLAAVMVFCLFRLTFPALPLISGIIAALACLMNRTLLVTSTSITPHVMLILFSGLTLFLMGRYARKLEAPYWYATAAALAAAVCSVETSFILASAVILTLLIVAGRRGWQYLVPLFLKGAGIFLLVTAVLWPKGILQLNLARGYLYLAYIAVYRRTFSPISPAALWQSRLLWYPLEFVPAALVLFLTIFYIRRFRHRNETLPFLIYACMFLAITLVVTAPYTHYYGSLLLTCGVLGGVVFGEIWLRAQRAPRAALLALTVAAMGGMAVDYYREAIRIIPSPYVADVLKYARGQAGDSTPLYVPYTLVPTLHYYQPGLTVLGYDVDETPGAIADVILKEPRTALLCVQSTCAAVEGRIPRPLGFQASLVSSAGESGEALYVARLNRI